MFRVSYTFNVETLPILISIMSTTEYICIIMDKVLYPYILINTIFFLGDGYFDWDEARLQSNF